MDKLPTRDELIRDIYRHMNRDMDLTYRYDISDAADLYDRIAARAVHDHMLKKFGPRPKRCTADMMQCGRFYSLSPFDDSCKCKLTNHEAATREELFAQCPKVEE